MLAAGLALSLLIAGQSAPPSGAPPTPPAPVTPSAPLSAPPAEPVTDPAAIAANLADMYEKSCGGRIYGTYAEACNNLAESLKQARATARRAERNKAVGK